MLPIRLEAKILVTALLVVGMTTMGAALDLRVFDGFEDGDYTSDPSWSVVDNGGSASVQNSVVKNGGDALELSTSGSGSEALIYDRGSSVDNFDDGAIYQAWVRTDGAQQAVFALSDATSYADPSTIHMRLSTSGGKSIEAYNGASTITLQSSYNDNEWYRFEMEYDKSNSQWLLRAYDSNDNLVGSDTAADNTGGSSRYVHLRHTDGTSGSIYFDDVSYSTSGINKNPQFNSSSVSPDPPLIGENVSYSAEVYDSDGSIDYTNLTLDYGGSTVVQDAQRSGTTPSWNDIYEPSSGNKWLNATFTTVDDAGATTSTGINRYLSDEAPNISLNMPGNKTYWSYDTPVNISVTDSDSKPGETFGCTASIQEGLAFTGGSGYTYNEDFTIKEGVNKTFTDTGRTRLSSNTAFTGFNVDCSDPGGNSKNKNVNYTVKSFELNSVTGSSNTFETITESFTTDQDIGDMVNSINYSLNYSNEVDASNISYGGSVLNGKKETFTHDIGLVGSDNTDRNYSFEYNISYTGFSGGTNHSVKNSSVKTQTVDQSYKFGSHSLEDGFTQLEGSVLNYTAAISNQTNNPNADLSLETEFKQTSKVKTLDQDSAYNFSNSFLTDLISSSSETHDLETNITISFQGDSRNIVDSKTVTLNKIDLNKNSNGDETLKFITKDEVNDTQQKSSLEMGLNAWNPDQPSKKRFYGFDFSKSQTHSLYLNNNEDIRINAFKNESIQYQNTDNDYPKRRNYLINEKLDSQTTNVNLYMLKNSEASNIEITLVDNDLEPLPQHIVRIERDFPSENDTTTVAMVRTGIQGKASTFLDAKEQYIFTVFNKDGKLIEQIGPQSITGLSITLETNPDIDPGIENLVNDVRFTDIIKNNDSLTVDYISETERLNNITLSVKEDQIYSTQLIDSDSSTDIQGRLKVSRFNASNQALNYELKGTFGETDYLLSSGDFGDTSTSYGDAGLFMSMLVFLTLSLAGLWRPSATIALGLMSVFVTSPFMLGLMPLGQSALISTAALAAVLIWRMS